MDSKEDAIIVISSQVSHSITKNGAARAATRSLFEAFLTVGYQKCFYILLCLLGW